jgi:transcriptional regulator with GAF, ATPase, and Fis domain
LSSDTGPRTPEEERRSVALSALAIAQADGALDGLVADLQRLCRAAVSVLGVRGAAVHVVAADGVPAVATAADAWSRTLAEAAFESGEGPCVDAYALARPVLATRLLEDGAGRWPGYLTVVQASGVQACFALPLHVGAVRLGVLELYAEHDGVLDVDAMSSALVFADLTVERLLEPASGTDSEELDQRLVDVLERRSEIHQAQGMVMVDLDVDLATALAVMRAHAFGRGIAMIDLAREILGGARLTDHGDR